MADIQLKNIYFRYGTNNRKEDIFQNLSLEIEEGSMTLLYGRSGMGKTTLLNILAGLLTPQKGEVLIHNQNLVGMKKRELDNFRANTIGFIFQMFYLIPQLTAADNVVVGMKTSNKPYAEKKKEAEHILKMLMMEEYANAYPEYLSGGQQQRVAIARAMANNCSILLADEPTGNLDKDTAVEVLDIFKGIKERGKTIIIVSHDDRVKEYCENIVYLEKLQNYSGDEAVECF